MRLAGTEAPGAGDTVPVSFGLLLNLASVLGAEATAENLASYVASYLGETEKNADLDRMIAAAVAYTRDFIVPTLKKRAPQGGEVEALTRTGCSACVSRWRCGC